MTDFEVLQAILDEIRSVKQEVTGVNARLDNLEQDNIAIRQELKEFKLEVNARLDKIEQEVRENTVAIETTVEDCLRAYADGYIANREKMDSLNIDSVNSKITYITLRQQYFEKELKAIKSKIS